MTVVVLPTWYPTAAQPVAGTFVRDHARAAALHREVVVVAEDDPGPPPRGLFALSEERDEVLRVFRVRHRRGRIPQLEAAAYLLAVAAVLTRLRREGRPATVLHAHVYRAGWAAALVGAVARLPVVISEHSSELRRRTLDTGARRRAAIAYRRADLVCPVSEDLRHHIQAQGFRGRFRVVPNAIDAKVFHPPPEPGWSPSGRPARLLNVAMHKPYKGLDDLLVAVADLDGVVLDLVGDGPQRPELEHQAERLGLGDRVRFHGMLAKPAIAELMCGADLFVLPSHTENLPVSLAEAQACGLPVVASDVGGVPEMVDAGSGRLAPPQHPEALRAVLAETLDVLATFDRAAIAARAAQRWSLEAVGAVWDQVYGELDRRA
jgi:glycosyltransferase involved in cell wall biosynthesis